MTYIKLDDRSPTHEHLAGLSDAAFGVWVKGLCHCSVNRTDGYIAARYLTAIGGARSRNCLIDVGLWSCCGDGGVMVVDYLGHNASRATIDGRLSEARERKAKSRRSHATKKERRAEVADVYLDIDVDVDKNTLSQSVGLSKDDPLIELERALFESIHRKLAEDGLTMTDGLTRDEAGTLRRVARDLSAIDVKPDEVHRRVAIAHDTFTDGRVTANAIGRNWSSLVTKPSESAMTGPRTLECSEHQAPIIDGVCAACEVLSKEVG